MGHARHTFASPHNKKGPHCTVRTFLLNRNGRDGRIRTDDPLPPRQMRYQAALRPDVYCDVPAVAASSEV